jgi:flagellar basal body rod protein FlgF
MVEVNILYLVICLLTENLANFSGNGFEADLSKMVHGTGKDIAFVVVGVIAQDLKTSRCLR